MTFTDAVETMITLPPCFILHIQYQDFRQFAEDAPIFLTDGWPPASLAPSWHPLLVRRHQRWPHEERPACILQDHSERIFLVALRHPNAQLQPEAWRFIFPMGGPWGGPSDFRCRCEITLWSSLLLGEDKMCDEEAHLRGL